MKRFTSFLFIGFVIGLFALQMGWSVVASAFIGLVFAWAVSNLIGGTKA